ncbi:hypothetical protein KI387_032564, partial [Taxus chinensis]
LLDVGGIGVADLVLEDPLVGGGDVAPATVKQNLSKQHFRSEFLNHPPIQASFKDTLQRSHNGDRVLAKLNRPMAYEKSTPSVCFGDEVVQYEASFKRNGLICRFHNFCLGLLALHVWILRKWAHFLEEGDSNFDPMILFDPKREDALTKTLNLKVQTDVSIPTHIENVNPNTSEAWNVVSRKKKGAISPLKMQLRSKGKGLKV